MDKPDYELVMPFWVDTEAYTDRDRAMFVAGVEFQMVMTLLEGGWTGSRPIHRENESRFRMGAAKIGRQIVVAPHEGYDGCETWSDLMTSDNDKFGE